MRNFFKRRKTIPRIEATPYVLPQLETKPTEGMNEWFNAVKNQNNKLFLFNSQNLGNIDIPRLLND